MATSPQPPRPPAGPQPPRSSSNLVAIALLLLALIVLVGGIGAWVGLRFLAGAVHLHVEKEGAGRKTVSIKTPLGSLEVNKGVTEASLGLPIYPGATPLNEQDSATVDIDIADQAKVHVHAGKFVTPDSLEKVVAFYRDRLGDEVTNFKEKTAEGKTVFEIKHDKQEKVVALKDAGTKTLIELVNVSQGPQGAN